MYSGKAVKRIDWIQKLQDLGFSLTEIKAFLRDWEDSETALAGRGGTAVAERLGTRAVTFPGGHDGFLGGEYGHAGKPDEFAATLRRVLSGGD